MFFFLEREEEEEEEARWSNKHISNFALDASKYISTTFRWSRKVAAKF